MTLNTLETRAAKVNLTTDLRNVIHQINPNDLLCAYKPTFEKWATRTLQDLEPPTEEDKKKVLPGGHLCSQDLGQGDYKVSMGWGLCPLPHSCAGTAYQRELTTVLKLSNYKRTHSSSTVDKVPENRTAESKTHKISSGLYPGRSTFHDFRIRDGGEERGFSSSYNRSHSPRHVPFKHSDCNGQHMTNYRETYTYKKIGTHKNQYMKRALASGLTLQHYPFRCCDNHCCPSVSRSGSSFQKDHGVITNSLCPTSAKLSSRSPQVQAEVHVSERKHMLQVSNGNRTGLTSAQRKEMQKSSVPQTLSGLNNEATNMERFNKTLPSSSSSKRELGNVLLDISLMGCRTHPTLPGKKPQQKMYHLTPSDSSTISSFVGSDSQPSQKK
ncbi:uncharacterized protein LOC135468203 [Liolophura sinensis]|uniref:uncharacterized protein LOC135468203 n=1 Tax=Liolophura sinensis TaxID=3198878 RepID=UPI0031588BB5